MKNHMNFNIVDHNTRFEHLSDSIILVNSIIILESSDYNLYDEMDVIKRWVY